MENGMREVWVLLALFERCCCFKASVLCWLCDCMADVPGSVDTPAACIGASGLVVSAKRRTWPACRKVGLIARASCSLHHTQTFMVSTYKQ